MRAPTPLLAAAVIEGLEGCALVGFATYIGVETVVSEPTSATSAVALTVTTVLLGLGALAVSVGLYGCHRWSRGPAVVTQIFALPVSATFVQGGRLAIGAVLALAGVLGLVLLLHPATTRKLVAG